jgi:hypothetical protein
MYEDYLTREGVMPKGSKVAKAERALKSAAKRKGLTGARAGHYVYGTLNKIGLKKGSKTTRRGKSPAHKRK